MSFLVNNNGSSTAYNTSNLGSSKPNFSSHIANTIHSITKSSLWYDASGSDIASQFFSSAHEKDNARVLAGIKQANGSPQSSPNSELARRALQAIQTENVPPSIKNKKINLPGVTPMTP